MSDRYKDRPLSPLDTAAYWIEYVARNKGAPFMKTAAVELPFYQYLLIDVIAFILISAILISLALYLVCKKLYSLALRMIYTKKKAD